MEYQDYYKILGLERDATPDQIKQAYRKLARKYHPDVSKETDAEKRFKEIGEAYAVLKDPEKKSAYDQMGNNWSGGQGFNPHPTGILDTSFEVMVGVIMPILTIANSLSPFLGAAPNKPINKVLNSIFRVKITMPRLRSI